jgi:hypothetical protein
MLRHCFWHTHVSSCETRGGQNEQEKGKRCSHETGRYLSSFDWES